LCPRQVVPGTPVGGILYAFQYGIPAFGAPDGSGREPTPPLHPLHSEFAALLLHTPESANWLAFEQCATGRASTDASRGFNSTICPHTKTLCRSTAACWAQSPSSSFIYSLRCRSRVIADRLLRQRVPGMRHAAALASDLKYATSPRATFSCAPVPQLAKTIHTAFGTLPSVRRQPERAHSEASSWSHRKPIRQSRLRTGTRRLS